MSLGFSRQEYWSGLPFPAPDDLPDPGLKPVSPALAGTFFSHWAVWEASLWLSVQFSHSIISNSLPPHESQHARPPCQSQTPRVYWNTWPSSRWCHPANLILCRPLLLLPPFPLSIRVFSNEAALHMRWPKYLSFSFSINPSNEHPGLICFRMGWLDLPAV